MRSLRKIVSGGQTGTDRAALDFAITSGIPHGGWCPMGRRSEDGLIPKKYLLCESPSATYLQRTEWNVRDSDGTVIFSLKAKLTGGSRKTLEFAHSLKKPVLHIPKTGSLEKPAEMLRAFIQTHRIKVLNVAGPRKSEEPGIGRFVRATLRAGLI